MPERWRVGRKVPIHLYRQVGPDPSDGDEPVGTMLTPEWAAMAADAVNGCAGWVPLSEVLGALRDEGAYNDWLIRSGVGRARWVATEDREILAAYLAERFGADQTTEVPDGN